MYVYLKNIKQLHNFRDNIYVTMNNGNIKEIGKEQAKVLRLIYKEYNNIDDIVTALGKEMQDKTIDVIRYKVNQHINSMNDLLEIKFSPKNSMIRDIVLTGEEGKSFPMFVQIALTNRCLHRCKHCYANACSIGNDINKDILIETLRYLRGKTPNIEFTGGEPFLYKNFIEILKKFSNNFKYTVATSGYWGKEYSNDSLRLFQLIRLTLYGYSEEEHNKFVGVDNSFKKVMKNIHKIMDADVDLIVQTQARSNDIEELRKFINKCVEEGIKNVIIGHVSPVGRARNLGIFQEYNSNIIQDNIRTLKDEFNNIINIIFHEDEHSSIYKTTANFFNCNAGKIKWHITESGIIMPCALFDRDLFKMGNIYNSDYIKLIENNYYDKLESKWYEERDNIYKYYLDRGISLDEVCDRV